MNHIFNEYVVEDNRTGLPILSQDKDRQLITYEPLENTPCGHIQGRICLNVEDGFDFVLPHHAQPHTFNSDFPAIFFPVPIMGVQSISCSRYNEIMIVWNKRPGDHYICVSYSYEDITQSYKIDWRKEGF